MNVVYFNITFVKSLIGPKLGGVPDIRPEQKMMRSESRKQHAYVSRFGESKRTRFKCFEPR